MSLASTAALVTPVLARQVSLRTWIMHAASITGCAIASVSYAQLTVAAFDGNCHQTATAAGDYEQTDRLWAAKDSKLLTHSITQYSTQLCTKPSIQRTARSVPVGLFDFHLCLVVYVLPCLQTMPKA